MNGNKYIAVAAMVCALFATSGARAETMAFDLSIRGITVGEMKIESSQSSNRYNVAGAINSTGIASFFRRFSYRGAATGAVNGARLFPARYVEKADTGRRSSEVEMVFDAGIPRVVTYTSPDDAGRVPADPAKQKGALDPLSGIYALLRDVPRNRACKLNVHMFDGRRRSHIAMRAAGTDAGLPVCRGVYERQDGFTAEEISRHRKFDFTLTYRSGANGKLQVQRVTFASFYGTAALDRR